MSAQKPKAKAPPVFIKPKLPGEDAPSPAPASKDAKPKDAKPTPPTPTSAVLPPSAVPLALPTPPTTLRLGPGLRLEDGVPRVVQAGTLFRSTGVQKTKTGKQPVESWHVARLPTRFFIPAIGDPLLLTVVSRAPYGTEAYLVSYSPNAPPLLLPHLAFENATKRNRPDLKVGDLVYGRVVKIEHGEGTVECMGASGRAEGYGELKGGTVAKIDAGVCRKWVFVNDEPRNEVRT